jgi:hypothetical protein
MNGGNGDKSVGSNAKRTRMSGERECVNGGRMAVSFADDGAGNGSSRMQEGPPMESPLSYGITGITGWVLFGLSSVVAVIARLYHTSLTKRVEELTAKCAESDKKHEECSKDREELRVLTARMEERLENLECRVDGKPKNS